MTYQTDCLSGNTTLSKEGKEGEYATHVCVIIRKRIKEGNQWKTYIACRLKRNPERYCVDVRDIHFGQSSDQSSNQSSDKSDEQIAQTFDDTTTSGSYHGISAAFDSIYYKYGIKPQKEVSLKLTCSLSLNGMINIWVADFCKKDHCHNLNFFAVDDIVKKFSLKRDLYKYMNMTPHELKSYPGNEVCQIEHATCAIITHVHSLGLI